MAMITQTYTVIVHAAEEGGFWGEVLELPGCVSQGETPEEFQQNIREAIQAVLEAEPQGLDVAFQVESPSAEYRVSTEYSERIEHYATEDTETAPASEERGVAWKSITPSFATMPTTAAS